MKKYFGRKQPPPPQPVQQQQQQPQPQSLTQSKPQHVQPHKQLSAGSGRSLPPIPGQTPVTPIDSVRHDSVSSYQSTRPSFQLQQQQQQQPLYVSTGSTRKGSGEEGSTDTNTWIVVDSLANGPESVQQQFIRPQPSFDSRSSSVASLPPGASPPVPYPPQPSPGSPYTAPEVPPPSSQKHTLPPPPPQQQVGTRRQPTRKQSDTAGRNSTYSGYRVNGNGAASVSIENLSIMSHDRTPQAAEKQHKKGLFDWLSGDKEKHAKERTLSRPMSPEQSDQPWDLTRIMGFVTATASEDWTLLMEVCERASTESGAKEAAKALRSEIKYADPPAMLSAARLWAIMLRNTKAPFIQETSSKKFLDTVEDAIQAPSTSPVVRDRLVIVVSGAAAQHGDKFPRFRSLWYKIKRPSDPNDGIPFDPKDAMFSPPSRRLPKPGHPGDPNVPIVRTPGIDDPSRGPYTPQAVSALQSLGMVPSSNGQTYAATERPRKSRHRSSQMGIVPHDEDVRRLFEECEMAKANATLLGNALTYAKPEEVVRGGSDGIIREFHTKCMRSQEIITAQIPWASAQADRARQEYDATHTDAELDPSSQTVEEDLLADLLQAHQELIEVLRVYDEAERLAYQEQEEREVRERSRVETRLDRARIQFYNEDGSFVVEAPGQGAGDTSGGGSSRSPSPSPGILPRSASPSPRAGHPLPIPPTSLNTPSATAFINSQHNPNGSSHTLAPPPAAPHGPRAASRTPSPERRSLENGGGSGGFSSSLKRGMSKLGIDVRNRSGSISANGNKGRKSGDGAQDDEEEVRTPIQPSAKALGKRKANPPPEDDFDVDDIFKERTATPLGPLDDQLLLGSDSDELDESGEPSLVYAYDAAAERKQERMEEARQWVTTHHVPGEQAGQLAEVQ